LLLLATRESNGGFSTSTVADSCKCIPFNVTVMEHCGCMASASWCLTPCRILLTAVDVVGFMTSH